MRHRPEQTTLYRLVRQHALRVSQTAGHLMDHVIPHVPVRQWVLVRVMRLPISLRLLLAAQPKLVRPAFVEAACTYRIAFGPRAGQTVLTVPAAMPRKKDFKQSLCADIGGFSLYAAVRCGTGGRQALEKLCRYIARPALTNERVRKICWPASTRLNATAWNARAPTSKMRRARHDVQRQRQRQRLLPRMF